MRFELGFLEEALKEWGKLDSSTREQFKAKLNERLENPRVPAAKLSGSEGSVQDQAAQRRLSAGV